MWWVVLGASMALLAEASEPLSSAVMMRVLVWWVGSEESVFDVSADGSRTPAMTFMF